MPKVFITRTVAQEAVELLAQYAGVVAWEEVDSIPREEFLKRIADVDGILQWGGDPIDGEAMDAAPRLRVIANVSVGYDNIDVEAATKRGIKVSNTPGVVTDSTVGPAVGGAVPFDGPLDSEQPNLGMASVGHSRALQEESLAMTPPSGST